MSFKISITYDDGTVITEETSNPFNIDSPIDVNMVHRKVTSNSGFYREEWFKNGVHHNLNGPAVIWGEVSLYFIDGLFYTKKEWTLKVRLKGTLLENKY